MAATAKHELRQKFPGESSGEEDIAAIAKQISDHAEAIYQTWKSRGLAPTEILNCHSNATAADKFGSALTPTMSPNSSANAKKLVEPLENILTVGGSGQAYNPPPPRLDNNNSLEKLVNNFVVEDKARQRTSYLTKNLPSSIQFALEKFERNSAHGLSSNVQQKQPIRPKIATKSALSSSLASPSSSLGETIESILPADLPGSTSSQSKRPLSVLLNTSSTSPTGELSRSTQSSGLTTWPLKNKLFTESSTTSTRVNVSKSNVASSYLDEVAREEERLINALKTGAVIGEDTSSPTPAKQKPAIKKEKPKLVTNVLERTSHYFQQIQQRAEESKSTISAEKIEKKQEAEEEREVQVVNSKWGPRITSPRPRVDQVPHPELTTQRKQHIRATVAAVNAAAATDTSSTTGSNINPVRPFLTRGSVAERVLIFEKCPSELLLDKRGLRQPVSFVSRLGNNSEGFKPLSYVKDKIQERQSKDLLPHTTLQRHVKANKNVRIPRFYFPGGKPIPPTQRATVIAKISKAFESLPGHRASRSQFHIIAKACDLPLYWKIPLFLAAGGDKTACIEMTAFLDFWREATRNNHDAASTFIRITTRGLRNYILPEDLVALVQDVVDTHPGLIFLKEATEFHSRYVHTVIARIFYCVNRSWSGKISITELRRSNLLEVIGILEHEEDINQVTSYFSYEHFYVIYCKFWELDRDHDLFIDKMDLTRHNDRALSTRLIERIFSGAVTRGGVKSGGVHQHEKKMSYTEFVWFLLSEEDKNHPTAIEYWFRCMDLDGDGYLSMYELEYFYEEQLHRMEAIGLETLPFEDCLCQMLDMIKPKIPGKISLSDLRKCKMTSIFFDTFFNLEKYLDHEQRDPFASTRDHDAEGHELSDWDRFAADEYELLVAEESGNEANDQMMYDNGMEEDYSTINTLPEETNDSSNKKDCYSRDYQDSSDHRRDQKGQNYDSGDSDDYAESDN
ncbi:serine/threonine-protein phosphatase 2A regulatory subunit B'' subunit alpha-like [Chelonus insularis]|uniref:serine/threonine-protein phosphatase 2A regulatory subunit B'' subunit alpha-like n=1 Tax=Chelonus insularis TaxID=460826 RepID=UPI001588C6EA|nr:serine/threonine-protein phosphatase 2A regulatory subunit B'' subunit alpha-like [Chelonus insularis]XP_034938421.1 serine/threonine-protein phosphatase 2A regulatory subunit B'' subunit alpha-like [Chelonus insularis]